jgi:pimeloyl-ACP methyl ester carboxylesterase
MPTPIEIKASVASRDHTEIAYWTSGDGPPIVLVHGTPADHTRWRPLLPYLERQVTVHAIDRRGRGASGDAPEYSLQREYEDIAAVVDAVAAASGERVDVYGHSHGGIVAFGAATLTANIRKLVLYEGWPVPDPSIYALSADVVGRMENCWPTVIGTAWSRRCSGRWRRCLMRTWTRSARPPSWPGRVAAAHTVTREISGETQARLEAAQAAKISVPVLLITGEERRTPQSAKLVRSLPSCRTRGS